MGTRKDIGILGALLLLTTLLVGGAGVGGAWAADPYIVISLTDRRLYLVSGEGETRHSFPVAIGRPGVEIPLGVTTVTRKRENPTWHPTANQRRANPDLPASVPSGPGNPLGRFALDLGWPTYAIHGTNDPESIGRRASGGCFRMADEDIETLFTVTGTGTPVRVMSDAYRPQPVATRVDERGVPLLLVPVSARSAPPAMPVPPAAVSLASASARPPVAIPAAAPEPAPPADPRCGKSTAPVKRLICDTPELALLDGRARQKNERLLLSLTPDRRGDAAYSLYREEKRFEERVTALCWVRAGTEGDAAATVVARSCLKAALETRIDDIEQRGRDAVAY